MSHNKHNAEGKAEKKENFETEEKTSKESEKEVKAEAEAKKEEKKEEAEKPAEDTKPGETAEEKAEEKKPSPEQEKIDDLTDRLKRQMAEFENFRKRTEKEKAEPGASWKRFFLSLTISNGVWQMPRQRAMLSATESG